MFDAGRPSFFSIMYLMSSNDVEYLIGKVMIMPAIVLMKGCGHYV